MDYNKLAQDVHEENKVKGFYDVEPNEDMSLLLIVSELIEMVEADRKQKTADLVGSIPEYNELDDKFFKFAFERDVKDTVEDEAVDTIIRMLDYAGWKCIDLINETVLEKSELNGLAEEVWIIIRMINEALYTKNNDYINYAFNSAVNYFTVGLKIDDIWKHVELKRKYNKLRPYKNGKKY